MGGAAAEGIGMDEVPFVSPIAAPMAAAPTTLPAHPVRIGRASSFAFLDLFVPSYAACAVGTSGSGSASLVLLAWMTSAMY